MLTTSIDRAVDAIDVAIAHTEVVADHDRTKTPEAVITAVLRRLVRAVRRQP
uniref:hypothetical protein n=1 Tax=Methylobacterium sp. B34 TaxID=95563 RepID=UPI001650F097|nr:hypothetical protein [Methylobacterium sp. B34]